MKRIIFGLMLAMMFCTLVQGANRTVTENDGQGNKKRVIELRDTVINGETVTDTLSIMTYAVAMLRKNGEPTTAVWTGTGSTSGARPRRP